MDTSTPWHTGAPIDPVEYEVALKTVGGETIYDLAVRTVELCEGISQPYRLTMTLLTEDTELERELLLKAQCTLTMGRPGAERTVHGVVTHCEFVTQHLGQLHVAVCVEPAVALLRYTTGRRIFQDLSVPEIVERVVADTFGTYSRGLSELLAKQYPPRDYCTQMDETDLAFLQRILAEEGICYIFAQGVEEEVLVLTDHNAAFAPVGADVLDGPHDPPTLVPLVPGGSELAHLESAQYFAVGHQAHTGSSTAHGWDWLGAQPESVVAEATSGELGAVGGVALVPRRMAEQSLNHEVSVAQWTELEAKRQRASGRTSHGRSNVVHMAPGSTCEISEHIQGDHDGQWVILTVTHRADCPEVELEWDGRGRGYENTFSAQHLEVAVAAPSAPRPNVSGPQTAVVVALAGEEIETDSLGRVRVRMHWDRRDVDAPTCWLRVAQAWAGQGFGSIFLPRAGMEVVVSFLDGDPDRPIVTGCVYNAQNTPPLALPERKSCSTIRTQSTPGGDGFNELRFDDMAKREEVYLHAQRNLTEVVKASHTSTIGGIRKETVKKEKITSVGQDCHREVAGSDALSVTGSQQIYVACGASKGEDPGLIQDGFARLSVEKERAVWAGEKYALQTGNEPKCTMEMTPERIDFVAETEIRFVVGNTTLILGRESMTVETPTLQVKTLGSELTMDDAVALEGGGGVSLSACKDTSQLTMCPDGLVVGSKMPIKIETPRNITVLGLERVAVRGRAVAVQASTGDAELSTAGGNTIVKGIQVRIN